MKTKSNLKPVDPPKRRGRPRIDPTGIQRPIAVRLTPAQIRFLVASFGGIGPGVRQLTDAAMKSGRKK